ncbi:MAG: TIGR03862 family flavoprotein [Dokdonella sp.]
MTGTTHRIAIIGGGPAGLMAAEAACAGGAQVDLYDALGSVGRKFLIAGKGGLNLTHSDPFERFVKHYAERESEVTDWLRDFDADALRAWARELGVETFVGSSGRVFPSDLKAAPLLRGWVRRLRASGVTFHMHHRWLGWNEDGALRFATADHETVQFADAVILALGGGSWPILGSDGAWLPALAERGVDIAPLQPANCGFDVAWSEHFRERHAGAPLQRIAAALDGDDEWLKGEAVVSADGIEGSLVYALSARLRDHVSADGSATLLIDLAPGRDLQRIVADLSKPRGKRSASEHLRRQVGIDGIKLGLLRERLSSEELADVQTVAATIKRLPITLLRPRPITEAISTAGGVRFEAMNADSMLVQFPGVFCAGEMIDWEAPTGGYLLSACFASGLRAGRCAVRWLDS